MRTKNDTSAAGVSRVGDSDTVQYQIELARALAVCRRQYGDL